MPDKEKDINLEVNAGEDEIKVDADNEVKEEENFEVEAANTDESSKKETRIEKKDKKKEEKEKKDKKDEEIADLKDRVTRQMAEFENFRKRTEKEKSQMFEVGVRTMVEKILPVVDNFERGLAQVPEDKKNDSFVEGMNMIYKQMMTAFDEIGVKPIEAVGKEFDPNLHNAVMHVDDDTLPENSIVEEFQKGYIYHDQVVRHSMVKVAN
ncbi:MAG: nucleotide exchange factor GrpE [Lachnospiraceae bacterium]|nr:nucleotide exchange factor GrpE [Lachnospiraceae bacterium]